MGNRKVRPNPRHARSWSPSAVVADLERIRRQMLAVARSSPYPAGRQQATHNHCNQQWLWVVTATADRG